MLNVNGANLCAKLTEPARSYTLPHYQFNHTANQRTKKGKTFHSEANTYSWISQLDVIATVYSAVLLAPILKQATYTHQCEGIKLTATTSGDNV